MDFYFIRDNDPHGGLLCIMRSEPNPDDEKATVQEIRKGEFPAETYLQLMFGEIMPLNGTWHDDLLQPYFDAAKTVWTREGGYVNGAE